MFATLPDKVIDRVLDKVGRFVPKRLDAKNSRFVDDWLDHGLVSIELASIYSVMVARLSAIRSEIDIGAESAAAIGATQNPFETTVGHIAPNV